MSVPDEASQGNREALSIAVQAQLNRLLTSDVFKPSARSQLLLKTIVTQSLAGETDALKEVVLGRDILGRLDYDPSRHTLVRVEINSLRRKLAEYYGSAGAEDRVRIEIPRGHYVAVFSTRPEKAPPAPVARRKQYVFAACAVLALAIIIWFWVERTPPPERQEIPVQITFDTGWTSLPAISRDGSVMVYSSDRGPRGDADIWIQKVGKSPRRLTDNPALDTTPDITPDGTQVVFRSTRSGDGLWTIAADAPKDDARLLARGYSPRFSPDGKWVSYHAVGTDGTGHIYLIPASGGLQRQIDYGTSDASSPVWSPDGTEVVFKARKMGGEDYDFWIAKTTSPNGQQSHPLGIQAKLHAQNLPGISAASDCPQDWIDDRLLFITHQHETSFLFDISLEPAGRLGRIEPIPSAFGAEGVRVVRGHGGRLSLLFGMERRQANIWGTSLDGSAPLEQLTHDSSLKAGFKGTWPTLSRSGNFLGFITERSGAPDICLKDLHTGTEQLLVAGPSLDSPLILDRDGSHVLFVRKQGSGTSVILRSVAEARDRTVATDCPILHDWSRDGNLLLCAAGNRLFWFEINYLGKPITSLRLSNPPEQARFSPDGRWISFVTATGHGEAATGFVAPLDGSDKKISISLGELYGLSLHWSPDGDAIYYWDTKDNFRCLYKQRLHPQTKVPIGDPIAVIHRHELQRYPMSGGTLAISQTGIAMTLKDQVANIWKVDLPR